MHPNAKHNLVAMGNRPQSWRDVKRSTFEAGCISQFMRELKMPTAVRKRVEAAQRQHGGLHIGSFNEALPNFPFSIATHSGEQLKAFSNVSSFFKPAKIAHVFKIFAEAMASDFTHSERPTLLLMKLAYLPHLLAIHNAGDEPLQLGNTQIRLSSAEGDFLVAEPVAAISARFEEYFSNYYKQLA